jgi:MYXO-CTERM domain-containing protein
MMGEPWSDTGPFVGSIDFDDVRVSAAPMASRLELRRAEGASASPGCLAVDVGLWSSASGALAPAPYETEVALTVSAGQGTFHADEACRAPVLVLVLPTGSSGRRVYFRPGGTGDTATLAASHPDFLPAKLDVQGQGSGEVPGETPEDGAAGPWTTDLGCTSAPGALFALPLLLAPWLRRRRERRTCPVE